MLVSPKLNILLMVINEKKSRKLRGCRFLMFGSPFYCFKIENQVCYEEAHHAKNSTTGSLYGAASTLKSSTKKVAYRGET